MTDAEIIKALECHANPDLTSCTECPLLNIQDCCYLLSKEAVDLINRQKAEIEDLKRKVVFDVNNFASEYDSKIKAEAIKELISKVGELTFFSCDEEFVYMSDIIEIGEEMVGEG